MPTPPATSQPRNASRPVNDNVLNGHLSGHPLFEPVCIYVKRLAHQKNIPFTPSDIDHAARGILFYFEPERLEKILGDIVIEPDAEAAWNINNYFDAVAADNMTHIFATTVKLRENDDALRALSDRLFIALKGDNPVGAPTLVWPSIKVIRFVAIIMRQFEPRTMTADTMLDVMTRVAQEGAAPLDDDLPALWDLCAKLFISPYEPPHESIASGNVVMVDFS